MYHYIQLDPSLIKERHEQMRKQASKLRLERRLRENREPQSGKPFAFITGRVLQLLRQKETRSVASQTLQTTPYE